MVSNRTKRNIAVSLAVAQIIITVISAIDVVNHEEELWRPVSDCVIAGCLTIISIRRIRQCRHDIGTAV